MASLKEFRNRIDSVKSTRKITKAMQMVAAAKLRKAQEAAEAARPYAERMGAVVANLSSAMKDQPGAPKLLVGTGDDAVHLLIVVTADRGLCGGFNTNIARLAKERISALKRDGKTVKILCVGKKSYDQLKRQYADDIIDRMEFRGVKKIGATEAMQISHRVTELFDAGEFDVATLIYARFKSVIAQIPTAVTLIPAMDAIDEGEAPDLGGASYEYEPEEEEILAELLPRNLTTRMLAALLENAAGEMGAKMSAMDNATRNAGEMIDKLTLQYNRSRQAMITKELIEIISGAEAL